MELVKPPKDVVNMKELAASVKFLNQPPGGNAINICKTVLRCIFMLFIIFLCVARMYFLYISKKSN